MFKKAFVRGVQNKLIAEDRAVYPNEKIASDLADYIADNMDFDPTNNSMTYEKVSEIANHLIDGSNTLLAQGYTASPAVKQASLQSFEKLAHDTVVGLMHKAAEGSTIEGGDKGNKEENSAEGKMDKANRPDGYANTGVGNTAVDTKPGAVGSEKDQPAAPSNSPAGANSVTEQKAASLAIKAALLKMAEGSTILGGDKGNKEETSAEGKMDKTNRPDGYAVLPHQGATDAIKALVAGAAVIGKEQPHPSAPSNAPGGSNSLTEQSKAAAEDPFKTLFRKTASEVNEFLPQNFTVEVKVAHVRRLMGLDTNEKVAYLTELYKTAGWVPPWLHKKDEDKKDDKDGDKDDKKEGKCKECGKDPCVCKKEDKKEASLNDIFLSVTK